MSFTLDRPAVSTPIGAPTPNVQARIVGQHERTAVMLQQLCSGNSMLRGLLARYVGATPETGEQSAKNPNEPNIYELQDRIGRELNDLENYLNRLAEIIG